MTTSLDDPGPDVSLIVLVFPSGGIPTEVDLSPRLDPVVTVRVGPIVAERGFSGRCQYVNSVVEGRTDGVDEGTRIQTVPDDPVVLVRLFPVSLAKSNVPNLRPR